MQILWRGKRIGCETASTAWERTKYLKSYHCVFRNMSVFWSIHGSFALAAHTSRTFLALGGASSTIFSGGNLFLAEISHGKIHASAEKNLWGFFPAENFFLRHPPKNFFRPLQRTPAGRRFNFSGYSKHPETGRCSLACRAKEPKSKKQRANCPTARSRPTT